MIMILSWQVLEFRIRKEMTMEMWTDRQDKIQSFFGPGVQADIQKTNEVDMCTRNAQVVLSHDLRLIDCVGIDLLLLCDVNDHTPKVPCA